MKTIKEICQEVKADVMQNNIDMIENALKRNLFPDKTEEEIRSFGYKYLNSDDENFMEVLSEFGKEDEKYSFDNVILTNNLNINHSVKKFNLNIWWKNEDGSHEYSEYGLSDNITQIINKYGEDVLIIARPFYRKDQPEWGGFRFHKWGEYIGDHVEEVENHEYIYETNLDVVWSFNIYTKERLLKQLSMK